MKISIWCPFISEVATTKTVLNTIKSIQQFSKSKAYFDLINVFGEWDSKLSLFKNLNVNILNFKKINLHFLFKNAGFISSRISYLIIFMRSILKLHSYIKNSKSNYLLCYLITSVPLFLLIFFRYDTKIVLRISGYPKLNFVRLNLWKLVRDKIHLVTCPSIDTYLKLKKYNIFSDEKLIFLPEPVLSLDEFREKINTKTVDEKNFDSHNSVLAIGRLTKQKNFDFLILAMTKFFKLNPNLKLFIIGEGEMENKLTKLIIKLKLNNQVFLLKHKNNVFKYLKLCKCFVLSSLWEDPGYVLIEAAMSNAIIISSNCPNGPREILNNGKNGYLYTSNSINDFEKKFFQFLNEDKKIIFKKKFNAKKNIRQYTLFYHYRILSRYLKI